MMLRKLQINTHTMLDKDRKSNFVKDSLPSIIRSSWTLKAVSVIVQHGVGLYLMFNLLISSKKSVDPKLWIMIAS